MYYAILCMSWISVARTLTNWWQLFFGYLLVKFLSKHLTINRAGRYSDFIYYRLSICLHNRTSFRLHASAETDDPLEDNASFVATIHCA